jgi:hypothetical protein
MVWGSFASRNTSAADQAVSFFFERLLNSSSYISFDWSSYYTLKDEFTL